MLQSWHGDLEAFQAVLGGARMPVILTDAKEADHPIVFVNQAFLDLTGYRRDQVIGRNCRFLQGAETDPGDVQRIRDALSQKRPISVEVVNFRADGSRFWNALFIGPIFDDTGELRYFLGNQLDVTQQKSAEEALHHRRKIEAVGQLATGLAQALNNLLQVVVGALELLAPELPDAASSRRGAAALRAARSAGDMVGQILAFARKAPLVPRPMYLEDTVRDMQLLLETATAGRRLRIVSEASRRRVLLDRTQLEAALLSLVSNARDATNDGDEITVRIDNAEIDGAPAVAISVEDAGEGMGEEVLRRASEPFFTTKASWRHTGMGLSMANGFAAQSRGRLEIRSGAGAGAMVRMVFLVDDFDRFEIVQDFNRSPEDRD